MSDIDPSDISIVGRRPGPEKYGPDLASDPAAGGAVPKPEREGLPPGYRMRADAHYVEQLTSRRADRVEARSLAHHDVEADTPSEGRERRGERVLALLGDEIAAISSAAGLLASDGSTLARRLSVDLIRAQAWRATWLVRTHALVEGTHRVQPRPRPIGSLLERIRQGLEPECRLAGVGLQVHASDWNTLLSVDEPVFLAGVTGAVVATLGLLGHGEGHVVRVSIDASGDTRTVDVSQDDVTAAPSMAVRFFDLAWTDRPGGVAAGVGAQSARYAAQQHGGTASLLQGDRRGTTVRMTFVRTH